MAPLPVPSESTPAPAPSEAGGLGAGPVGTPVGTPLSELLGMVVRNRWLILLCTLAVTAGAAAFTVRARPVYEAAASLRFEDKESSLPDVYKDVEQKNAIETETQMLMSRIFSEEVTDSLALQ